ncbi:hypothetical protein SEA_ORCANUS_62 [Arthrobacter phage Orcanus]|nr:hypothetical protein SEA_ORCANUS_62 [Arthrobacter phage Orcanus]WAB09170.1 hypothetical protein SEA_EESA_61 [Arthrobacter phage Eesa]
MSRGAGLEEAVVRFMGRKFDVDVVTVPSLEGPGFVVMREDGKDLEPEQLRALGYYVRGYRVFGGPS